MPPKTPPEAILFVLDVGPSVCQEVPGRSSFLKQAISCISMILQRKLFDCSKDAIGLILCGTPDTANSLAEGDQYQHISMARHLAATDWAFIRYMQNELSGSDTEADWLDSLVVGMDYLREQTQKTKYSAQKIILFTDFGVPVADDQVDVIIAGLKNLDIELVAIGQSVISSDDGNEDSSSDGEEGDVVKNRNTSSVTGKPKTAEQIAGESLMSRIVTEVDGMSVSFQDAIPQLMFFNKKNIQAAPWNVTMDIGPDIKIAVSGYIKIKKAAPKSWKNVYAINENTGIEWDTSYHQQDENQTVVEKEETIDGYRYGSTLVPFSEEDKANMDYKSGLRCLSVLGFTRAEHVKRHLFVGEGTLYVLPRKGDQAAAVALSALIHALEELNMVGIARRVYNRDFSPKLGALIPKIRAENECLIFIELPFLEDLRQYIFAPLCTEKNKPSEEQLKAIDSLINDMDLMTAEVDEEGKPAESLKPKKILNPYFQHMYQCMMHRALKSGEPLPDVSNHIRDLLVPSKEVLASCVGSLQKLAEVFSLQEVKAKRKKQTGADIFKSEDELNFEEDIHASKKIKLEDRTLASLTKVSVTEVGTVTPVEDFTSLLAHGEDFKLVCKQMQGVIFRLVTESFGSRLHSKSLDCLKVLREQGVKNDPLPFNAWLREFKTALLDRGQKEFWDELVKANQGLISRAETDKSSVLQDEVEKFTEVTEETTEQQWPDEAMDADDLLDEL